MAFLQSFVRADRQERWALTKALVDYLKLDDTILIASIDFSHYLSSDEAQVNDRETRQVMTERDYPKIESWGSEHLDSLASLMVFDGHFGSDEEDWQRRF